MIQFNNGVAEMKLKYAMLLIFLVCLYPIQSIAGTNTATIKTRCYSIVLGYANAGSMWAYFTTYDGLTVMPLTEYIDGMYFISEELSPVTLGGTQYRTDYIITTSSVNPYEYGSVTFTIPYTDSNDNGFPDIGEIENSVSSIYISGSARADYNYEGYATTATVSSYLSRAANAISGTYYGSWTNSLSGTYNFSGIWSLISGQGSIKYTGNTIDFSLTITNSAGAEDYTGTTTYTIDSDDQITVDGFEMEGDLGDNITVYSAVLHRDGEYFRGNFQIDDGNSITSWRDYYNWQLEIQDDNDWDEDGIPDLTDPNPSTPKDMSWLPLLLEE
jgi:hypothetical protein